MPSVDDPRHRQLESSVEAFLAQAGFMTTSCAYHDVWPAEMKQTVSSRWSFTALYLRGRADRIAVHKASPIEFEYECKTGSKNSRDMMIEALPFLHHLRKSELGVACLYVYMTPQNEEKGFWCHNPPPIRDVFLPAQRQPGLAEKYGKILRSGFGKQCRSLPWCKGSGDPFCAIDITEVAKLKSWQVLVADFIVNPVVDIGRPVKPDPEWDSTKIEPPFSTADDPLTRGL